MPADPAWRAVTKGHPCPICGKPDWCARSGNVVRCMRPPAQPPADWHAIKFNIDGGTVYSRDPGRAERDFTSLHAKYLSQITDPIRKRLAADLGVSIAALATIETGWTGNVTTFPERDAAGRVIGITTRDERGQKKSMKSGKRGLIIPRTQPAGALTVCVEGPTDVAACLTMEVPCVGRPSATGGGEHLVEYLRGREVLIVGENDRKPDGSHPGLDGAKSIAKRLANAWQRPVRYALPPAEFKDVRAYLKARPGDAAAAGAELLASLQASAVTVEPALEPIEFTVDRAPGRVRSTVTALREGRPVAADSFDLGSERDRARFAEQVAGVTGEDAAAFGTQLLGLLSQGSPEHGTSAPDSDDDLLEAYDGEVAEALERTPARIIDEAKAVLADPALLNRIGADLVHSGVVGEEALCITVYLIGVSRLLAHPLAGIVQGTTSSGKSYIIERVAGLFPEECLFLATDLTPNALYYLEPGRLIHRWVVAGERSRRDDDVRAEATRALREMLSSGHLRKAIPIKMGDRFVTVVIHQPGPIAFIESTTVARIFDEDANRSLLLATDESPKQTRLVLEACARRASTQAVDASHVRAVHHAAQRLLKRCQVTIPYAERLADAMPSSRPEARRAIEHTFGVIRAVALLHQRQRCAGEIEHGDEIAATVTDYVAARRLLEGPLGRALGGGLPEAVIRLGQRMRAEFGDEVFSTSDAIKEDAVIKSRGKMGEYLRALAETDALELVEASRGNKPAIWRFLGDVPEAGAAWLPQVQLPDGRDPKPRVVLRPGRTGGALQNTEATPCTT